MWVWVSAGRSDSMCIQCVVTGKAKDYHDNSVINPGVGSMFRLFLVYIYMHVHDRLSVIPSVHYETGSKIQTVKYLLL